MAQSPFDSSGITRGDDGITRYDELPASVVDMLRRAVDSVASAEAIVEVGAERLSYQRLWDRASRVAGGLREGGLRRGDRVAIRLPNGVAWVVGFLGTLLAGAVSVPVNMRFTDDEAAYVIGDSGAALTLDSATLPQGSPYVDEDLGHADLAALFYTSGTTGFPKGARTTHGNLLSIAESSRRIRPSTDSDGDRSLISVPLFHVTGCNSQLLSLIHVAGTSVLLPSFTVPSFLAALQDERITMSTSVPAIYWLALQSPEFAATDLSRLRVLSYGGAPMAPELVARLRERVPGARLGNGYGLSEAASVVTYLPHEWSGTDSASVGFPIPVDDARVTADGELLVRGPNVVDGYWQRQEETAATFVEGWLHTGDVAAIDSRGLVTVLDRLKDMICRGGENVYSIEVENALAEHPLVGEVSVLPVPDPVMGEKVGALFVPAGAAFDVAPVLSYAREVLADFKVPQYVAVRTTPLPRNPGGKVLKRSLAGTIDWQPV